jgi:pimeloyl-ACP methyl ester carboxylesterase
MAIVRHSTVRVGPANVFYREAGTRGQPVLLLLHGFANSSHYFRHLMPKLAGRFHLIAPDMPSFGFTTIDEGAGYQFTFAGLTKTIQGFVNELSLRRFALYVFDYGAPVGFNLAVANPDSISAIVSQNGNAYEEGLGTAPWDPLRAYWAQPSQAIRETIKERMSLDGVREAYFQGVSDPAKIEPEAYWLDTALLARPGMTNRTSSAILCISSICERIGLHCWRSGDKTTTFSFHRELKRSSETSLMPTFDFWRRATSPSKPTSMTSRPQCWR